MVSLFVFILFLNFMCQVVGIAVALPIPQRASLPHLEAPRIVTLEMGFQSLFTTALLFSILGAYMIAVFGGTRTPAFVFMRRLPRGATLQQTINRLPSMLRALGSRGYQRRIPTRRGRISSPMATVPRLWAPRPTRIRHAHLPLPL